MTDQTQPSQLAFRVWRYEQGRLHSVVHGGGHQKPSWIARQMTQPEGAWPVTPLRATCAYDHTDEEEGEEKIIPGVDCTCGVYATTDIETINHYFSAAAPVIGLVAFRGRVIPGEKGIRGQFAKVAAIFLVDPVLPSLSHGELRRIAAAYNVPALVPHSLDPEAYHAPPQRQQPAVEWQPTDSEIRDFLGPE